jgi:hypothetical protein
MPPVGLPAEPGLVLRIVGEVRGQHLQGDHPVDCGVECSPHFAHAAAAKQVD